MEEAIVALGLQQHGVFRLDDLRRIGLTNTAIHKRVAAGRLHRCY
ncbi:MAG: type IV toxin-antitoxin system AbiEi family antitoxin domain-containing protein, partial [Solirubrobacteraceae bacterium]